ncbi:DUF3833 domain-containing protein [Sedimentitalea sp. XS_ASV28]|uniref:DUF3833 domain-containing protein n=1 Tax=Sedimentitalea sp. XS_ASV28 TaxID=3241296 RepID=UPI0035176921
MKLLIALLVLVLVVIVVKAMFFSFRAQSPADYAETTPAFSLKTHLSGPILSEGLIYGPGGRVTSRFTAKMHGIWDGDTGTLSEEFTYSTGRKQSRKWYLTLGPGDTFTATADDIVGEAKGVVSGATLRMEYEIILPQEAGGHTLKVTDWLYLTQNGVIMNRSELRKFGIKVAELMATMRPDPGR